MQRIVPCFALGLIVSFLPGREGDAPAKPQAAGNIVIIQGAAQTKPMEQTPDEITILELTNKERKAKDLPALELSAALSKIARAHSENMARQRKMEHKLDDKEPKDRVKDAGYKFSKVAENIGMGEKGAQLPQIMKAWMNSEGHRKSILSAEFSEIGVGIARGKAGDFYITQVFAKPRK
jgi:uncharacterized protein YkwD